nr:M48 family metalloprotease [Candidatus Sigynarchaeota archaeon]
MNRKNLFVWINIALAIGAVLSIIAWLDLIVAFLAVNVVFWITIVLGLFLESEFYQWVKKSKRSGTTDLLFIMFMFFLMFLITADFFTGILGAFAMYLIIGALELKGHQVVNKVIYISAITYNVMFFASIVDFIIDKAGLPAIELLDKIFSLSFWLILVLGFVFFGRRYIVVWRFMSPQYITLAIYLLAWVFIATVGSITHINIFEWIYPVLAVADAIVYLTTGWFIDKFLGVKPIAKIDERKAKIIQEIVDRAKQKIGLRGKVKIGFGNYPIINAMAYGPVFDKRVCVIAPADMDLPEDELEAIIAHELGHLKSNHPTMLLAINAIDLGIRWIFKIPATYYDFAFGKKFFIFGLDVGILGFIILNIGIFAILYVFVRVMEAKADFIVKRAGLGKQLAKALYNLESFYALGKQTGLNVMLLADEKIDEDHAMLNYIEAARTIYKQLSIPPKSVAVTTLLNSHPPTFLRIANMLLPAGAEYTAWLEARLPGQFLRKKNVRAFTSKVGDAKNLFDEISRAKFMELFGKRVGDDLPGFLESILLHGDKDFLLKNQVLATSKLEGMVSHVQVGRVQYHDSIALPYSFTGVEIGNKSKSVDLMPYDNEFAILNNTDHVRLKKLGECTVKEVFPGPMKKLACMVVDDRKNEKKLKYAEIRNQVPREFLTGLQGKAVFIDDNEAIDVIDCDAVKPASILLDIEISGRYHHSGDQIALSLRKYRVSRFRLAMAIHEDAKYADRYTRFFTWCKETGKQLYLFLKKPVNNEYYCKITVVDGQERKITIKDQFGKVNSFTYKDLEIVMLDHDTVELKNHAQDSIFFKLAFRLAASRKSVSWIPPF